MTKAVTLLSFEQPLGPGGWSSSPPPGPRCPHLVAWVVLIGKGGQGSHCCSSETRRGKAEGRFSPLSRLMPNAAFLGNSIRWQRQVAADWKHLIHAVSLSFFLSSSLPTPFLSSLFLCHWDASLIPLDTWGEFTPYDLFCPC